MISNDVNVIFAYLDVKHKFHGTAGIFVAKHRERGRYVMLANVMNSFLKTYKDYVFYAGDTIVRQVIKCKEERKRSPVKKPSAVFLSKYIEPSVDKELREISEKYAKSLETLKEMKKLMLAEYSIPELYFSEDKIGEFREDVVEKAEDFSLRNINKFAANFRNIQTMKIGMYKEYDLFFQKVKMKDYEDRKICAELFAFGKEKGKIKFFTFDKKFKEYLKKNGKSRGITVLNG